MQRKCEQYWAENMGEVHESPNKVFSVTTTSVMQFADFVIRTFSVKNVSGNLFSHVSIYPVMNVLGTIAIYIWIC